MSILSAQVDELRELATRYDELQVGAVKAVTMPSDMGSVLRDAADTIWELRDSVHRERAEADRLREQGALLFDKTLELGTENAKLQEELESVGTAAYLYGRSDLKSENAKLRELVDELYPLADYGAMDASELDRAHDLMRELGIEVDG